MMNIKNNVKAIYHLRKVNHAADMMDKYRHDDKAKFEKWERVYVEHLNIVSKINHTLQDSKGGTQVLFLFLRVFYMFYYEKD